MVKKAVCFALGGHIATQNASFKELMKQLPDWEFYGAEDGFEAFKTGNTYPLSPDFIPREFSGFYSGAGRAAITDKKTEEVDTKKLEQAIDFFKKGGFDIAIGSGGDDHGRQLAILAGELKEIVDFYVLNKTMDNDLGGNDKGDKDAPYTDFTNGYITAVEKGVDMIHQHFSGAWTNNLPYLIGHFGRETNWVGIALAYWGLADRIIYGELPKEHDGHPIDKIAEMIKESQEINAEKYGRKFAMIVVPEGTRITGVEHVSKDLIDAHGHHKLQPEVLVTELKKALENEYRIKTQTIGITYEMRNFAGAKTDLDFAEKSAVIIAEAIKKGNEGVESTFKIHENGKITTGLAPIEKVSAKRYANYYIRPLIDEENFTVTDEIGKYYRPLFGQRKSLEEILPQKPKVVNVYKNAPDGI